METEELCASRLVFVDETGLNTSMTRLCARALSHLRAFGRAPKGKHTNLTVVGAVALDGVRALMAYEGGTTREAFLRFVNEALVPSLKQGDIVIMDNLRAHYTDGVRQQIEAANATVMYLPPYSPELNPIEQAWSKLKAIFRRLEARTLKALTSSLPIFKDAVRFSDLAGWFGKSGYGTQSE
jgi:transposase